MSSEPYATPTEIFRSSTCANCRQRIYQRSDDTPWYHENGGAGRCVMYPPPGAMANKANG